LLSRKNSVYTVEPDDDWQNAARFTGALCLIEFYVAFVTYGAATWDGAGVTWGFSIVEWNAIPLFCNTVFMYLCGRSLRQREPRRINYLWFGIFGFLAAAILSGVAEAFSFYDSYELYSSFGYGVAVGSAIIDVTLMGLLLASPYLNVLFLLLVLIWATRSKSKHSRSNRALWVTCAVVYCIAHIPPTFLSYHFIRSAFEGGGLLGAPAVPRFVSAIAYGLLLLGLVMLLYRKRSSASCLA